MGQEFRHGWSGQFWSRDAHVVAIRSWLVLQKQMIKSLQPGKVALSRYRFWASPGGVIWFSLQCGSPGENRLLTGRLKDPRVKPVKVHSILMI